MRKTIIYIQNIYSILLFNLAAVKVDIFLKQG